MEKLKSQSNIKNNETRFKRNKMIMKHVLMTSANGKTTDVAKAAEEVV